MYRDKLVIRLLITEHKIQGDSLCELDSDGLKILGISSVGHRLSILKSIYQVKTMHSVPIEEQHYVPPCWSFRSMLVVSQ